MSYLSARRSPYPYHFKIGDVGLMLGAPSAPTRTNPSPAMLVSSKSADIAQVAPPDFSEERGGGGRRRKGKSREYDYDDEN